jgi:hypothetical protein
MVNGDNADPELNEVHIIWEIKREWDAKYFRRSTRILFKIKKCDYKVDEIVNHRKQAGFEGELLVVWNTGERDWSPVERVFVDNNEAMVEDYLSRKNLSKERMKFGLYMLQQEKIEKQQNEKKELKRLQLEKVVVDKVTPKTRGRPARKQPAKRKLETEYDNEGKKEKPSKYNKKVNSSIPKSKPTRSSKRVNNSTNQAKEVIEPNPIEDKDTHDETGEKDSSEHDDEISPDAVEMDIADATDITKEIANQGYVIPLDAIEIEFDLEKFKDENGLHDGNYTFKVIEYESGKRILQGKFYNCTTKLKSINTTYFFIFVKQLQMRMHQMLNLTIYHFMKEKLLINQIKR